MALVAPGIARFTVNGTYADQPVANILDMQVDTTGTSISRSDALFGIAGDILNNWVDHILPFLADNYVVTSVSWVDLNSAEGDTGSRVSTSAVTLPQAGGVNLDAMPGSVSLLVRKQISGQRGRRSGRMYLVGVAEGWTADATPNDIPGTILAQINPALDTFLTDINDTEGQPIGRQQQLVVVHTRRDDVTDELEYVGYSPVDSLLAQQRLATQRRRLR